MAKIGIIGLRGEDGYWLVDFDKGTVAPVPPFDGAPFGYTDEARKNGAVLTAGIDLAVGIVTKDDAFAGKLDSSFGAKLDDAFAGKLDEGAFSGKLD